MVKKLMKYEMQSYARLLVPVEIILLGIAVLNRFIQFLESDAVVYDILFGFSTTVLVVGCITATVMTWILTIIRFYKNLFTNEGYLTFTLPVTRTQILWTKLLGAIIVTVINLIAVILAGVIATAGDVLAEVGKAIGYIFDQLFKYTHADGVFYIIEFVVLLLLSAAAGYLLFCACIAVGQLAKKNRILLAFGVYFGYYTVCQMLFSVLAVLAPIVLNTEWFENLLEGMIEHWQIWIHVGLCSGIVISAVLALVYYLITNAIIKKHLNLE